MDAAEEESLCDAISAHGHLLGEQHYHLGKLDAKLNQLTNMVSQAFLTCSAAPTSTLIPRPSKFSGDTSKCERFLPVPCISLDKQVSSINKK